MTKVALLFSNGTEECEALIVVDILRRAGMDLKIVSVSGDKTVTGSHDIKVVADELIEEHDFAADDVLVIPGGMPGTNLIEANEYAQKAIKLMADSNKYVCAICAAPKILGHGGYLVGKNACIYPGMDAELTGAKVNHDEVNVDGKFITSRGLGTAIPFALAIMEQVLTELAADTLINTFGILGSLSISTVAKPLGDLADSLKKWKDVEIPGSIGEKLDVLAGAITSFTFDGFGAGALAKAAPALGDLADAMKKWKDVSIREDLGDDLQSIARGVERFDWLFTAGWSLDTIAKPLGEFAESISKWKDVEIPVLLCEDLSDLAEAIKKFSFAFTSGWSLDTIVDPIGKMADSISKWKDASVPASLPQSMKLTYFSVVYNITGIGTVGIQAAQHVHQRGLAGTIGTDNTVAVTFGKFDINIFK